MGDQDDPRNGREPEPDEPGPAGSSEGITGGYGGPGPENETVSSEDEPQDDDGEPVEAPD